MGRSPTLWLLAALAVGCAPLPPVGEPVVRDAASLDLVELWSAGRLHVVSRSIEPLREGTRRGVRLDEGEVPGIAWIEGVDFRSGTVELEVRGRDVPQRSFVGVAFHGVNDSTYDAVYLRPFNFRSDDAGRRARAVQYVSHPTHTWSRLREAHPGVYEQGIADAPDPDGWVRLRVRMEGGRVSVYIDDAVRPSLVVEQLSGQRGGRLGLWVGNPSDGAFSNLRIETTPQPARAGRR
jgi:hypothetical protein